MKEISPDGDVDVSKKVFVDYLKPYLSKVDCVKMREGQYTIEWTVTTQSGSSQQSGSTEGFSNSVATESTEQTQNNQSTASQTNTDQTTSQQTESTQTSTDETGSSQTVTNQSDNSQTTVQSEDSQTSSQQTETSQTSDQSSTSQTQESPKPSGKLKKFVII